MNFKSRQKGFTLIELLVVIVIIGVLATLATVSLAGVRSKARDAKRVSDVRQIQNAFEMFFSNEDKYPADTGTGNGSFSVGRPLTSSDGTKTYMIKVPSMPTPSDGSCPTGAEYTYTQTQNGASYTLGYCLGGPTSGVPAGSAQAWPGSINNVCVPSCGATSYCGDSDGCSGKCTTVPSLTSGTLTCVSYQLMCGTTVVADYRKINQCSGNTATCSGAVCTGNTICSSGTCVNTCSTDSDCGLCQVCSSGSCGYVTAGQDTRNQCDTTGCLTGNCDGSGACSFFTSGKQNCNNCQQCNASGSCVGCSVCCKTDNTCGASLSHTLKGYMMEKYPNSNGSLEYYKIFTSCPTATDCQVTTGWTLMTSTNQTTACGTLYTGANNTEMTSPGCSTPTCNPAWGYYKWSCYQDTCN